MDEKLKELFDRGIYHLNKYPDFENIDIRGEVMAVTNKDTYWSHLNLDLTKAGPGVILCGHATISLNFRDIHTEDKVIRALAHESAYILVHTKNFNLYKKEDELYYYLRLKLYPDNQEEKA